MILIGNLVVVVGAGVLLGCISNSSKLNHLTSLELVPHSRRIKWVFGLAGGAGWTGQNFYNFPRSNHLFLLSPIHSGATWVVRKPEDFIINIILPLTAHTVTQWSMVLVSQPLVTFNGETKSGRSVVIHHAGQICHSQALLAWSGHYYYSHISPLSFTIYYRYLDQ